MDKAQLTTKWSEKAALWIETDVTNWSSSLVMRRSNVWPAWWVGEHTCCFKLNESVRARKWEINHFWRFGVKQAWSSNRTMYVWKFMDFVQYLVLKLCSIIPIYTLVSFMHCKHCHNTVLAKDYLELKDKSTDYNISIGPFSNEQLLQWVPLLVQFVLIRKTLHLNCWQIFPSQGCH